MIKWVTEGLETDEINERAAKFNPPFEVSRPQVAFYRDTRKIDLSSLRESGEFSALTEGYAIRENRVRALQDLAHMMHRDLTNGFLWLDQVRMIGYGENQETVDYEEFNTAEVREFRGVLDDIAKEMGQRRTIVEMSTWESRAIELIRANQIDYHSLVDEFGPSLAQQLFSKAGVPIILEESKET